MTTYVIPGIHGNVSCVAKPRVRYIYSVSEWSVCLETEHGLFFGYSADLRRALTKAYQQASGMKRFPGARYHP